LIEYQYAIASPNVVTAELVVATRPISGQTERDVRVFQNIEAALVDGERHVYATDGNSRLVHYTITDGAAVAENVTQIVVNAGTTFGYFDFQDPHGGRVYTGLEVLIGQDGRHFVYGTEGSSLVLFIREAGQSGNWRVSNLTNDTYSIYGDAGDRTDSRAPAARVPANAVFGSPGGYIEGNGDRHIFQINAEGEVVEYYIVFNQVPSGSVPRFHTQNINLRTGLSPTKLLHKE
jgi:hypothetical protein